MIAFQVVLGVARGSLPGAVMTASPAVGDGIGQADATVRPIALLGIAASSVAVGGILGASMNAINGAVSPEYFRGIFRWDDVENIWRAALAMGIFSGLMYGIFFAFFFTLVVGVVSRVQCRFSFAARQLLATAIGVYICWVIGGLIGLGLAALSPDFFQRTFIRVPEGYDQVLRYAWVGGSNMAAMTASVLALVIACILFAARWRRVGRLHN